MADGTIKTLLRESELFRSFPDDALERVLASAALVEFRRNDLLFEEGDEAPFLFVVCSGRIAMLKRSLDGRESMLALMEEGDLFGEMPLFSPGEGRSATARALEGARVVTVPYPAVRSELDRQPELLWGVVDLLAGRLRVTNADLADSMFLDVTGRTAKRLLELSGGADTFVLPVTQEELAGMVGASRERVNKALAAFLRLGWLEQTDRKYRIRDRTQLERRAT
jgi:CRP-like cAMP-binding protein